ncbi:MAG TPA: hypothetical protein VFC09_16535 [Candidatus Dormibacteraeota bacterium]|nr:hypothetical protein [Candidatus Dormibacteraeota bacterium]
MPAASNGLHDLACSGPDELVWTTVDDTEVWAGGQGTPAHKLVSLPAGHFIGNLHASGHWAVFVFGTAGPNSQTESLASWQVYAVDLTTGAARVLDSASSGAPLQAEPTPSVTGDLAIWDRLTGPSSAQLITENLASRVRTAVPLPTSIYPVRPFIDAVGRIVFLNHATDPNRGHEEPTFRGGAFMAYDPATHVVSQLDSSPTANFVTVAGQIAAWWDPDAAEFFLTPTSGGPRRSLGKGYASDYLSETIFVMRKAQTEDTMLAVSLATQHTVDLPSDVRASDVQAVCGSSVYVLLNDDTFVAFTVA